LKRAIEIVNDSGGVPVDVDERLTLWNLEAQAAEIVADKDAGKRWKAEHRIRIWIPLTKAQIIGVVATMTMMNPLRVGRDRRERRD
jgi:hypothetical protein